MSKNLLIITPGFPKDESDDTCIPALQIYLKALLGSQYFDNIMVVSVYYPITAKTYFWHSVKVVALVHSQKTFFSRAFSPFMLSTKISNLVKAFPLDLIHSFWINQTAILGNMLSKKFKVPHIATTMGQDVFFTKKLKYLIDSEKLKLIAVSEFQKEKSSMKVNEVIHWGVEVIQKIRKVKPDIKVVIVGDGPEREKLLDKVKRLRLEENVILVGQKSRLEVLSIMRQSKVLLHTSRFESFGMVFVEALNAGMYTLSERVGIAGEHEKCIVVSGKHEMAEQLVLLLNNKMWNFPKEPAFSVQNTLEGYLDCYNKALKKT